MDDFKEFDELTAKWDGQARASAKAFITKHYLKKSVVRVLVEAVELKLLDRTIKPEVYEFYKDAVEQTKRVILKELS